MPGRVSDAAEAAFRQSAMDKPLEWYEKRLPNLGVEEFVGEALLHRATLLAPARFEKPADGKGLLTVRLHLHGNLVVRAADAAGLHFDKRLHIVQRGLENLRGRLVRKLLRDNVQGAVENRLRDGLLAVVHEAVDELRGEEGSVFRIRLHAGTGDVGAFD